MKAQFGLTKYLWNMLVNDVKNVKQKIINFADGPIKVSCKKNVSDQTGLLSGEH